MFWLLLRSRRTPRRGRPYPRWMLAVFAAILLACCVAALFHHDPAQAGTGDVFTQGYIPPISCVNHGPGWITISQTAQFPAQDQKRYGRIQVTSTSKCTGDDFTTVMTPSGHNFGIYDGWEWKQ